MPLSAMVQPMLQADTSYVYCGKALSNIGETIALLSELDDNGDSPVHELHEHIKRGFYFAEYDAVVETLEYAQALLEEKQSLLDSAQVDKINHDLGVIINQVTNGELIVNSSNVDALQDLVNEKIASLPSSLQVLSLNEIPYSESVTRLVDLAPALVVSTTNIDVITGGLLVVDGVALAINDRVLLVGQTDPVENGLWLAQSGSWSRPGDFATGNPADQAYVLIASGSVNAGSSWLCTTPAAVIDTDPIAFALFSYPDIILGANVGAGTGLIFRDKTGTTLNFKSLIAGTDIVISNNADDIALSTNATSDNIASAIVARDASGNFSASAISVTDEVISSSLRITPLSVAGVMHNNASGLVSSSLVVNADISASAAIVDTKLATIGTAGKVSNSATTANSVNLGNAIVARDFIGNFAAGTITASLSGNATSATTAITATTSTDFTGSLVGDVTGTQGATVVSTVGGQTAANVASAIATLNSATSANGANTLVMRDALGRFSTSTMSVTDEVITGSLTISPLNVAGVVHNSAAGLLSTSLIVNADINASAAIADSKLATISTAGKILNSATTATGLNTANAIVARDAAGNFSAGIIIASLNGSASNNILKAGDTMTGALQLPAGTVSAPSLMFTGSTTAGLSAVSGNLVFSTNALERMKIASGGALSIKAFTSPGVMHNDSLGNVSSSLIVNSDVAVGAAIVDTKLATITSAGKVNNSATTATNNNVSNTIIKRDSSGNFTANILSIADVTMSGNLILGANPSTSTSGNVFKDINTPFIHNFGTSNTFLGEYAGNFTMTGSGQNTVVGAFAFGSNSAGESNTGMGYTAFPDCVSGTNNIAIGVGAAGSLITGNGNIYINANASTSNESATTRIGTSQTKCFVAGVRGRTTTNNNAVAVLVDSAGQLGTVSSSKRYKHDIKDMNDASAQIFNLRPVTFAYNADETDATHFGLIAEEVAEVLPSIVVNNEEGQVETVQYHILPVLLLNEMKKQQAIIDEQQTMLSQQAVSINDLNVTVATISAALASVQEQIQQFIKA